MGECRLDPDKLKEITATNWTITRLFYK